MRILHVITMLDIGGAEHLLVDILPLMRDAGHDVELLLFNGVDTPFKKELEDKGIKIHELCHGKDVRNYTREVYDPYHIIRLRKYMRGYDIIHTHNTACQLYLPISKCVYKGKSLLVTTEHNTTNRRRSMPWFKAIDKWMYNQYSSIICISEQARINLEEYIGKKNAIVTINNGANIKTFVRPIKDVSEHRNFVIVMVAGFREQKDHETLIRAMRLLPSNYHLLLVGDGVKAKELRNLTKRYSVSEKVTFMGSRLDVPDIYEKTDVAVLSSHWEGFGLAAVEAMASGRPLIASNVGGLRDVVKGAGILFTQGNDVELAAKIQWLCEHPDEYREVAKRCQERAQQYDISVMAEKYMTLYNELL